MSETVVFAAVRTVKYVTVGFLEFACMSVKAEEVLKEALHLPARERATIADDLLSSLDRPDREMDRLWIAEVENRIEAEVRGEMSKIDAEQVFAKYERR